MVPGKHSTAGGQYPRGGGLAHSLTSFCRVLEQRLPLSTDTAAIKALFEQLESFIALVEKLSESSKMLSRDERQELDHNGTNLWNLVTKLQRAGELVAPPTRDNLLIHSKYFALQVLDLARVQSKDEPEERAANFMHLRKLTLKTAKYCLNTTEIDFNLARKIFEKAVTYGEVLKEVEGRLSKEADVSEHKKLDAEYFILRTAFSWKEGRLDVAEHMYNKSDLKKQSLDPKSAENLSDVLFEIGKDLSNRMDFPMATKWLQRAYDVVSAQPSEILSRDGVELRLSICQALVSALLGDSKPESSQKAMDLISKLESEIGDRPVTLLLHLEFIQKAPAEVFDSKAYSDVLRRMIHSFDFSESHFQISIHHIRKLYDKSPALASRALDEMLRTKITQSGRDDWLEKGVILRVWMATTQRDCIEFAEEISDLLTTIRDYLSNPLSANAAAVAQTLIWKRVDANYSQCQYGLAENWCKLALHEVFESSPPLNRAKIQRKLILCALSTNDLEKAQDVFDSMSDTAKDEPFTRYLAYKIAVRIGDRDMARDCLETVSKASTSDSNLLYACVVDAHQAQDKICVLEALQALSERHKFRHTSDVHLPALFRCRIRLLCSMIDAAEGSGGADGCAYPDSESEICNMFEDVVEAAKRDPRDEKGERFFTAEELDWFCKHSYNLGIRLLQLWDLRHVCRLFDSSLSLIGLFPSDIADDKAKDLSIKRMLCNFIIASAHVSVARSEDVIERQQVAYLSMRSRIAAFDAELEMRLKDIEEPLLTDLTAKLACLLVFDFEGAVWLQQYDELGEIVHRARECKEGEAYKAMADCLLRATVPPQHLLSTMKLLIDEISAVEGFGAERLAKYFRCLFQVMLPLDDTLSVQLFDEAIGLARQAVNSEQPYPREEVEWLVATSFNHAIDLYGSRQDAMCRLWAEKSINLAGYCNDGGILKKMVEDRYILLRWDAS